MANAFMDKTDVLSKPVNEIIEVKKGKSKKKPGTRNCSAKFVLCLYLPLLIGGIPINPRSLGSTEVQCTLDHAGLRPSLATCRVLFPIEPKPQEQVAAFSS